MQKVQQEEAKPSPSTTSFFESLEAVTPSCPPLKPKANQKLEQKDKRSTKGEASQGPSEKQPRADTHGNQPLATIIDNRPLAGVNNCYPEYHKTFQSNPQQPNTYNPVAYWARTSFWPKALWLHDFGMADENPSKRRKSETTHRSSILRQLAEHGISMENSKLVHKDSKELCNKLLKGKRTSAKTSIFTREQFAEVLERVRDLNEPRIVRDVTPWIVPSAEILWFLNELELDYIGDGLSVEWTRCATMGSKKPKPDYIAALSKQAYSQEEIDKLENYITSERLFWFTPELSFPFLVCEAKPAAVGLNEADRQNIHSASIAVRAIFTLHQEAFSQTAPHRVHELYGKILVFSVSHNHDQVSLYGHFAVADSTSLKYHRYLIDLFSLSVRDGENQYKAYNFVQNVYEQFAPAHLKRIKDAVAHLPTPAQRTGLSFATSNMSVGESDSEQDSQEAVSQDEGQMMPPPSIPDTAEREQIQIQMLKEQVAIMKAEKEKMNAQLNSFIQSNERLNSENVPEVMKVLRQQQAGLRQELERQRQEAQQQAEREQVLRQELEQVKHLLLVEK